jgi:hypothetical protein
MAIGASLWGLYNQTGEFGAILTKPGSIGCQYNYRNLQWMPGSAVFDRARAAGLRVANWQDLILVNMLGKRFYDETGGQFIANNYNSIDSYVQGSHLNARNIEFKPNNFLNAALAGMMARMEAVRSGRFSIATRSSASNGSQRRRMSTSLPDFSSERIDWPILPRRSS